MTGAAPLDREKLAAVLGMLGSAHDGEILAAARKAERMRQQAGETWGHILAPPPAGHPNSNTHIEIRSIGDLLSYYEDRMSPWERRFCRSLCIQRSPISEKQRAILDQILDKIRAGEARAA